MTVRINTSVRCVALKKGLLRWRRPSRSAGHVSNNKSDPGELAHFNPKRLLLRKGLSPFQPRVYLLVTTDDFSRELGAAILTDKTQGSVARFLAATVICLAMIYLS
ncbi:hypothetical protein [Nitrosomonas sp. Nm58]|uniref:hypothetical protein n=1 Tax=Nitrosomonas sp. Nm58 TaxID=200126 RepID=UPI00115F8CD3|nr:hypothetical protein [Nitrosomonas sp. Nm58]